MYVLMSRWQPSFLYSHGILHERQTGNTEVREKFREIEIRNGATYKQGRLQRHRLVYEGERR